MKLVSQLDAEGYFLGAATADESPLEDGVYLIPRLCIDRPPPAIPSEKRAKWVGGAWVFEDIPSTLGPVEPPAPTVLTQLEKDQVKFLMRASAKDGIIASFAAENLARVRAGIWTTANLIDLTQDAGLKSLLDNVNTLSFEIAASMVPSLTNALLTTEIKAGWVAKLQSHFYNS